MSPDLMSPGFYSVNAAGQITGFILPVIPFGAGSLGSIQWIRASDGQLQGDILGTETGTSPSRQFILQLDALETDTGAGRESTIIATVRTGGGAITQAKILDQLAGGPVTSDFIRGTAGGFGQARFGKTTVTFGGVNQFATNSGLAHGLGTTPTVMAGTFSQSAGLTFYPVVQIFNVGATTFDAGVCTSDASIPAAGSTAGIYWLAIA